MVHKCELMIWPEELIERGFEKIPGKFPGTSKWIHNGEKGNYEPQLTIYQDFHRCWHCRADLSVPRLVFGNNCELPSHDQIREAMHIVSNNCELRSGIPFDAFTAFVCRIDYAINILCEQHLVGALIAYFARFDIARMLRKTVGNETVYFENNSRAIRVYNKLAQTIRKYKDRPELIERAIGIVRAEYYVKGQPAVNRFVGQRGLADSTVNTLISPNVIESVTSEMLGLLHLENVDLCSGDDFRSILAISGDIKEAIGLFGFKGAIDALGEDFYRDPSLDYSKSTYERNQRKCRDLGLSL